MKFKISNRVQTTDDIGDSGLLADIDVLPKETGTIIDIDDEDCSYLVQFDNDKVEYWVEEEFLRLRNGTSRSFTVTVQENDGFNIEEVSDEEWIKGYEEHKEQFNDEYKGIKLKSSNPVYTWEEVRDMMKSGAEQGLCCALCQDQNGVYYIDLSINEITGYDEIKTLIEKGDKR